MPSLTRRRMRPACPGVQASSEKSPNLMPLMPLSALSAGFRVALAVALDALVALAVALECAVLPPLFGLPVEFSPMVALVASSVGLFRKAMTVPRLSSERGIDSGGYQQGQHLFDSPLQPASRLRPRLVPVDIYAELRRRDLELAVHLRRCGSVLLLILHKLDYGLCHRRSVERGLVLYPHHLIPVL